MDNDEDQHNLQFTETIEGTIVKKSMTYYRELMKTNKHNIAIDSKPKMTTIGDYLDKETIS